MYDITLHDKITTKQHNKIKCLLLTFTMGLYLFLRTLSPWRFLHQQQKAEKEEERKTNFPTEGMSAKRAFKGEKLVRRHENFCYKGAKATDSSWDKTLSKSILSLRWVAMFVRSLDLGGMRLSEFLLFVLLFLFLLFFFAIYIFKIIFPLNFAFLLHSREIILNRAFSQKIWIFNFGLRSAGTDKA